MPIFIVMSGLLLLKLDWAAPSRSHPPSGSDNLFGNGLFGDPAVLVILLLFIVNLAYILRIAMNKPHLNN